MGCSPVICGQTCGENNCLWKKHVVNVVKWYVGYGRYNYSEWMLMVFINQFMFSVSIDVGKTMP
jgi:hypothetical protein